MNDTHVRRPAEPPRPLTPIQRDALRIIQEWWDTWQITPSREELAHEMGLAARSGAARLIDALEGKGWIRRPRAGTARSITVLARVPMPDFAALDESHWSVLQLPPIGNGDPHD